MLASACRMRVSAGPHLPGGPIRRVLASKGDVHSRAAQRPCCVKCQVHFIHYTINTIYRYLHNDPFQSDLSCHWIRSWSQIPINRSCIGFLLWGIDLRTVLATHLSSQWRFRGESGQVALTCEKGCWVLTCFLEIEHTRFVCRCLQLSWFQGRVDVVLQLVLAGRTQVCPKLQLWHCPTRALVARWCTWQCLEAGCRLGPLPLILFLPPDDKE